MAADNFNRANETPLASPWVLQSGSSGQVNLVSNAVQANTSADKLVYYSGSATQEKQYSQAVINSKPNSNDWGPAVRIGSNGLSGYIMAQYDPGSNFRGISKFVAANFFMVATGGSTTAVGDTARVEADGTSIKTYKNGILDISGTDSSLTTAGNGAGLFIYESGGAIDDWEGGDIPFIPYISSSYSDYKIPKLVPTLNL